MKKGFTLIELLGVIIVLAAILAIITPIVSNLIRDSKDVNKITITFVGTGFLRYMVRNMVGLLIEIGEGKRKPEDIIEIFKYEDRRFAGKTAPSCGLYLKNVFY